MRQISFGEGDHAPRTILCLGAHSDDIEIGCGGTVLRLLEELDDTTVWWVVFSSDETRRHEARASAEAFLGRAGAREVIVETFRDGFFPAAFSDIKMFFENLKTSIAPDLIFSHYGKDGHQDHRTISELTWNTFRDHSIFEYEIPKYDGDLGSPNFFVSLEDRHRELKTEALMQHFASQRSKRWFSPETFDGLARLRGIESNAPSGYAEAFYCRKMLW